MKHIVFVPAGLAIALSVLLAGCERAVTAKNPQLGDPPSAGRA